MITGWITGTRSGRGLAAGVVAALVLGGCAGQRPIEDIRADGDIYFKRGEFSAAAGEYRQIVDRYPGDWRAEYQLGLSELKAGNPSVARQALEIAHTRRPRSIEIEDALAEAMFQMGDEDELFRFLRQSAETSQHPHDYLRLAAYSLRLADPDSAQHAIDRAMEVEFVPTVESHLAAADLAEWLDDRAEAVRRLRQAYGIDPSNAEVKSRLRAHGEVPGPTIALAPGN